MVIISTLTAILYPWVYTDGTPVSRMVVDSITGYVSVVVVALLFYVHGKHLRSCRDGQLT